MHLDSFFQTLWDDYVVITPDAKKIHAVLKGTGPVINDHVAFRTYNLAPIGLNDFVKMIEPMGYQESGTYHFEQKKLFAKSYQHADPKQPKIFISELLLEKCSPWLQAFCTDLVAEAQKTVGQEGMQFPMMPWGKISYADYQKLLTESEYAAWVAAFGLRANHFTVSVNALTQFKGLAALNAHLKQHGFELNDKGGDIKGSTDVGLMQSSTMAQPIDWPFADGVEQVPSCYYEFAERFPVGPKQELYQGFVTDSADKIFESTDRR